MFYIMYEKVSKRLLNWGVSQEWGNKQELIDKFGSTNIVINDKYTEEQFNEAKKDISIDIPLTEVCIIDTVNEKLVIDEALKVQYEKKLEGDKLIDERAIQIYKEQAKTELISEGILDSDGLPI